MRPSRQPTSKPTAPTGQPTRRPSHRPSSHPTRQPTSRPTKSRVFVPLNATTSANTASGDLLTYSSITSPFTH